MKKFLKIVTTGQAAIFYLAGLAVMTMVAIPATGFAEVSDPPTFLFKDRCVPYQLTDAFMLANGIDPDRIIGGAGPGGGGGGPQTGPGGGNIQDLDEYGNPDPTGCDEFHTSWRRGTYEACHFYDGSPCYFTVNGQLDQDSFTDDDAGRRAFEIGEHFVIYEMVQNGPPELAVDPDVPIQPIATNPFWGGFAVGTQTKIINAGSTYWQDNPSGIWKIGFVRFTGKAFNVMLNPPQNPDEIADQAFLLDMAATNGVNSQGAVNGGMPLIVKGDEIFALVERGLASLRYRVGADGAPGEPEGPRYLLCPVHENPAANGVILEGEDIIQKWETVLEFQVPCRHVYGPDASDLTGRGFTRECLPSVPTETCGPLPEGDGTSCTVARAFPFGPTPPPTEQCLYDHFDCLQRTGDWCGGSFKSDGLQCPPAPFQYD
jgi:hypothetical protein